MPRPRTSPQDQDNGYDAFLDIVANLVGILIILVMVVGVRMRQAFEDQIHLEPAQITVPAATQSPDYEKQLAERNELNQTIARTRQEAATVEQDTQVLAYKIDLLATETARQTAQRNQLQLLASAIEHEIQQHRAQLDEQSQQAFDGAQALAEVEQQLEQTRQAVRTVALEQEPPPTILKHYETPIATTVHGQEEHFRIKGGSIARIPLERVGGRDESRLSEPALEAGEKIRIAPANYRRLMASSWNTPCHAPSGCSCCIRLRISWA